jgi:signal transduction histidine kinase
VSSARGCTAGTASSPPADRTIGELVERAADEVEADLGVLVEVVRVGDCEVDDALVALGQAAREAIVNAAKHAGVDEVSVYVEVEAGEVAVYVRDRGVGFDPAAVAADRRGIADSIVGRLARQGGRAVVRSVPGEGTEVELSVPRRTA